MEIRPLLTHELEQAAAWWHEQYELFLGRLRWSARTPYALALGAVRWDEVEACGTAVVCGGTGRITALRGQRPQEREAVAQALIAALERAGCTGQVVHAAPADAAFWGALGFAAGTPLLRYTGGRFLQATWDGIEILEPAQRLGVIHLDRKASGEERSTLLLEHEYMGRACSERGTVRGFTLALLGEGLIVADDPDLGLELQRWHFPIQEHVLLWEGNSAHQHLTERGYRAEPHGLRMTRGTVPPHRPALIFAEPFDRVEVG